MVIVSTVVVLKPPAPIPEPPFVPLVSFPPVAVILPPLIVMLPQLASNPDEPIPAEVIPPLAIMFPSDIPISLIDHLEPAPIPGA